MRSEEKRRLKRLNKFETAARLQGFQIIAGIDEAGRGPLAGPVIAAACIIPDGIFIEYVNDSKKLLPEIRKRVYEALINHAQISYAVGLVDSKEIDRINIFQATLKAMQMAVDGLSTRPDLLFIDGPHGPEHAIPSQKIVNGDALSHLIAAASIIAKETRDALMLQMHEEWPQYGFREHKGYGTKQHLQAIEKYGPSPIHRLSFSPFKPKLSPTKLGQ